LIIYRLRLIHTYRCWCWQCRAL